MSQIVSIARSRPEAEPSPRVLIGGAEMGRLPDFIIGGAPKCGTTSLHFMLDQHDQIAMPDEEIHYFDADDPIAHPDFFHIDAGRLKWFDPDRIDGDTLNWYRSRFREQQASQLIGEDSTTYLFSEVAARRISERLPKVKLIFMLRHPVERAYSQYWHLMNTARTSDTFERAIARYPIIVLGSTYTSNLRRYFDLFAREQVKVVFFEEFISSQQQVFDDITDFLGVSALQVEKSKSWYNRTNYTVSGPAQRQLNRIGRHIVASRYRRHMNDGDKFTLSDRVRSKLHYWFFRYVNPALLRRPKPPPMDLHTRAFLTEHLAQRNKGLSELLGRDVSAVWTDLKM